MHSRCLLQVLLALSSLILSKARDVIGSDLSCVRSSPADDGQTRVTFLREDTAGARSLYVTLWCEDDQLVTCEVNPNPVVTERYRALCDKSSTNGQEVIQKFNLSALLAPDAPCALGSSGTQKFSRRARTDGKEVKTRRTRAVIFPGTLWCGHGSRASAYDQLGMFESADRCCREHDHCPHVIPAFTVNYGVFNSKFFTVSGCDCDQRFRQCLLSVNDTISTMVGYSFFSIMQVPCFELREQKRCTTMSWWGMCKAANVAPYAVYKSPLPYNSSDTPSKYEDNTDSNKMIINVTESPVISTKSPRSEHRCSSREPPRGDTFHRRRKKGKGCKRHKKLSTATPTHLPQKSKADTTTPSICLFNASRSSTFVSNKKRAGKNKGTRKNMSTSATQKSQAHLHVTTNSYPQTSSTQSTPSLTLKPLLQPLVPTVTSAVTKTTKRPKKHGRCCGSRMPLIGDALQSRCKTCQDGKHKRTTHTTTVAPSTTTYVLPIKATICTNLQQKKTKETAKQETLKAPRSRHTSKAPKPAASAHTDGKPQRPIDSQLLSNHTNQESKGRAKTQITPAGGGLTDNHFLCESLKHLDKCKYKIPPLEKRYDLQNKESKTAYHCDCTSRLALQIESFSQPSVLPMLIMDFVSQFCFKLPKEKKCHRKKSCSGGFTKASDLLRALKKIEEKDTAGVRNSVNVRKRGIPVRLSKRCLRLQREAHIMAQLTRL